MFLFFVRCLTGEGRVQQDPARARGPVDEVLQQRARRHEGFQPHARGQGRGGGAPGLGPGPRRTVCQGIGFDIVNSIGIGIGTCCCVFCRQKEVPGIL